MPGRGMLIWACFGGALPLVAGSSIFFLWCATGWPWLEFAGFVNIGIGLASVGLGALGLLIYFYTEVLTSERPFSWRRWLWCLSAAALLALNFPLCAIIVGTVTKLQSANAAIAQSRRGSIAVVNTSARAVEMVHITGLPNESTLARIPAGEARTVVVDDLHAPTIAVTIFQDGTTTTKALDLTGTNRDANEFVAAIKPDGDIHLFVVGFRWDPNAD